jgi:hypothetical protein
VTFKSRRHGIQNSGPHELSKVTPCTIGDQMFIEPYTVGSAPCL